MDRVGAPHQDGVPFVDLTRQHEPIRAELEAAFARVLASGRYILGPEVERFEAEMAARLGVRHAIGVSSGTDALLAAFLALGIGPGDEVVTSPYSFVAAVEGLLRLDARPVFADIEPRSFGLDPKRVGDVLTPRTRAIVPVHLFGGAVDMPELLSVAERYEVPIVEDAAQALGASVGGRAVGTFGALAIWSFFPTKNLGALGDAGLVTTDDDTLAERIRSLRSHGVTAPYEHDQVGGNFRLDELQAALLRVKLRHLDTWNAERQRSAAIYDAIFDAAGLAPPLLLRPWRDSGHVASQYVIRTSRRDALRAHLASLGIGTATYYPRLLNDQHAVRFVLGDSAQGAARFPVAEHAASTSLALPLFVGITEAEIERVVRAVVKGLEG